MGDGYLRPDQFLEHLTVTKSDFLKGKKSLHGESHYMAFTNQTNFNIGETIGQKELLLQCIQRKYSF